MKIILLPVRRLSRVLLLCAAYLALLLPAAFAQPPAKPAPPAKTISMDVSNGDLHAVLLTLEHQTQIQARVQDDGLPFKPVNVHLVDATLTQVLRSIAKSAGAKVTKNLDGVYVFTDHDGSTFPAPSSGPLPPTPKPTASPNPAPTRLYKIILRHTRASEILNTMRWGDAARARSTAVNSGMPDGVVRVYAGPKDVTTLFIRATPDGFLETLKIVKIVDDAGQGFSPQVSFLRASPDEAGLHYHYYDPPIPALQVFAGDGVTAAFRRLTKSGRSPTMLKTLHELDFTEPLSWTVSGVSIFQPRLYADETLTLQIRLSDSQQGEQPLVWGAHIGHGDILAVVQTGQPLITFLKVDW